MDGNNLLYGGKGNDVVNGGIGIDIINGDLGDDLLSGGAGSGRFDFRSNDGNNLNPAGAGEVLLLILKMESMLLV